MYTQTRALSDVGESADLGFHYKSPTFLEHFTVFKVKLMYVMSFDFIIEQDRCWFAVKNLKLVAELSGCSWSSS